MFNQRPVLILFLGRTRFSLFGGNLTGIITLDIPDVVIRDLEIISKDAFYTLIKQWVRQYTVTPSPMIVILSEDTYFDAMFSSNDHPQIETDVLKFFDSVPFDTIWTKVYTVQNGKRAVAINKAWHEAVAQGFSLQGFQMKMVVPAFTLGALATKHALDAELAQYVFNNYDALSKQNLMEASEIAAPASPEKPKTGSVESKPKSNLPLLLGVFGVLIAVLIVVVLTQFR